MPQNNPYRSDFPAVVNHPETIFFDNAATTQKLNSVIRRVNDLWENGITAVGRSSGKLAREQMQLAHDSQRQIAQFFGATTEELIVTPSATLGLNLVAQNLSALVANDEKIILALNNHHSNIAPWIKQKPKQILWAPFSENGKLDVKKLHQILEKEKVRVLSITLTSNVLGVKEDLSVIEDMVRRFNQKRQRKIFLVVDAAAAMLDQKINWRKITTDIMILSGHKMYAPAIAGILVRRELLQSGDFSPVWSGGGMLKSLNLAQEIVEAELLEQRWRPGVIDLVSLVAWAQACAWLNENFVDKQKYLFDLTQELTDGLQKISGIQLLGGKKKTHLVSFVWPNFATVDVMAYLSSQNILAREGYHCCQPLHEALGLAGSIRLSLAHYNNSAEVEKVLQVLRQVPQVLWQR